MITKILIFFLLIVGVSFGQKVKTYPQDFSAQALKNLRQEIGDTSRNALFKNQVAFEDYGAVGDGVTDDSVAIYNALISGKTIVGRSGSTYILDGPIALRNYDIFMKSSKQENFIIKYTGATSQAFLFEGDSLATDSSQLSADAYRNEINLVVESGDSVMFARGDIIYLYAAPQETPRSGNGSLKGEVLSVADILGDTLYIDSYLHENYIIADGTYWVKKIHTIDVSIEGMTLQFEPQPAGALTGMRVNYANRPSFDNCKIIDSRGTGLGLTFAYGGHWNGGEIRGIDFNNLGYGIKLYAVQNFHVTNTLFTDTRKGIDCTYQTVPLTTASKDIFIEGNIFSLGGLDQDNNVQIAGMCVDTHAGVANIVIQNNIMINGDRGVYFRGNDLTFNNNILRGRFTAAVNVATGGGIIVKNNNYWSGYSTDTDSTVQTMSAFVNVESGADDSTGLQWVIKNNEIHHSHHSIFSSSLDTMNYVSIENNDISFIKRGSTLYLQKGGPVFENSSFVNNNWDLFQGATLSGQIQGNWDATSNSLQYWPSKNIFYTPNLQTDNLILPGSTFDIDTLIVGPDDSFPGNNSRLRMAGAQKPNYAKFIIHNTDNSVVANDTLSSFMMGVSGETSIGATFLPLFEMALQSGQTISGLTTARGIMNFSVRNASDTWVNYLVLDGLGHVVRIKSLMIGDPTGDHFKIDSITSAAVDSIHIYGEDYFYPLKGVSIP